jgi:insulysin
MSLVVYGQEPIDVLASYVQQKFEGIQNKDIEIPSWLGGPFPPEKRAKKLLVMPVEENLNKLILTWQLPPVYNNYLYNPTGYISSLIENRMHGSLFSALRDNGWATSLSTETESATNFALFLFELDLTAEGMANVQNVIGSIFQYLDLIKEEGIDVKYWNQNQEIKALQWRFIKKEDVETVVQKLSSSMHSMMPQDLLRDPSRNLWSASSVLLTLQALSPANLILMQVSEAYATAGLDQVEPIYKTSFKELGITKAEIQRYWCLSFFFQSSAFETLY